MFKTNTVNASMTKNRFVGKLETLAIYSEVPSPWGSIQDRSLSSKYKFQVYTEFDKFHHYVSNNSCAAVLLNIHSSNEALEKLVKTIRSINPGLKIFLIVDSKFHPNSSTDLSYLLHHGISGAIDFPFTSNDLNLLLTANIKSCIYEID